MKIPKLSQNSIAKSARPNPQNEGVPSKSVASTADKATTAADQTVGSGDGYDPASEEKASEWEAMNLNGKITATAVPAWLGLVLGGTALIATTALTPLVAAGIGAAAGIAVAQAATRLNKTDKTKSEVAASKEKRAEEPSSWKTSKTSDKVIAMGVSGWLGASVIGIGLGMAGVLGPVTALAVGAGAGMAIGRGVLGLAKDSDPSSAGSDSDNSSRIGLTTDGELGFSLGGGMVMGTDGKIGFGYEL